MDFYNSIEKIVKRDARYKADAYEFVMQALHFTQDKLKRKGHVTGKELLEGIREFAWNQYGPMAIVLFEHWGAKSTGDFGEIVFNMVENGLMKKTDKDSREDFKDVYDFKEAFDTIKEVRLNGQR